jgi:hypothetical protein
VEIKKKKSKKELISKALEKDPLNDPIPDDFMCTSLPLSYVQDEEPSLVSVFDVQVNVYRNEKVGKWKVGVHHKNSGVEVYVDTEGSIHRNRVLAFKLLYEELQTRKY